MSKFAVVESTLNTKDTTVFVYLQLKVIVAVMCLLTIIEIFGTTI